MASEKPYFAAKIVKIGDAHGLILSDEVLTRMNASAGDSLFLIEGSGGYRLTSHDPEFEEQMAVAKEVMKDYRDVLRDLAK